MDSLYKELRKFGKVKANAPLSRCSTFRIGGPAQFLVEVDNNDNLISLLNFLSGEGVNFIILGGGSNFLFSDEGFAGVVIKIKSAEIKVEDETIVCEGGTMLGAVVSLAGQNSLSGLEWAAGIPGTVGGAVRGNAGAMGQDASGSVNKVEIWRSGEVLTIPKKECDFEYRESIFKKNHQDVILRVRFKLAKGDQKEIMLEMQKHIVARQGKFPAYPSPGSFFKNIRIEDWPGDRKLLPPIFVERGKVPAAYVIEQAGMKGYAVGGAKISDEHANFVINYDKATQADVLAVVEKVKEAVYNKFGVELEPEVEIIS